MVKLSLTMKKKIKLPSHGFWFKASVLAVFNPVLSALNAVFSANSKQCYCFKLPLNNYTFSFVSLYQKNFRRIFSRTVCKEMISHLLILANRQWLSIRSVLFPQVLFDSSTPFSDKTRHPFLTVYNKNDKIGKLSTLLNR